MGDWKQEKYHGFTISSRIVPSEGDYSKWEAEISSDNKVIYQFRLIITGTVARSPDSIIHVETEGIKRVHARIDFGEFIEGEVHEHKITSSGEELSHAFQKHFENLFSSESERSKYYLLLVLKRLRETPPVFLRSSQFDLGGWAYYLAVNEDEILNLIEQLGEQNLVTAIGTSHPTRYGVFLPTEIGITVDGIQYLEQLEQTLLARRRQSVMPAIEENAFIIARVLYDGQYFGVTRIIVKELKSLCHLTEENFSVADNFLADSGYCSRTMGSDKGYRSLTSDGVMFVKSVLKSRFELSNDAELLARYLSDQIHRGKSFVSKGEITQDMRWEELRFFSVGQELVDEGLAIEKPRDDRVRFGGLELTSEGRRAVRKNFKRSDSIVSQQVNQQYGDQITISNVGDGAAVAAGRGATTNQGLSGEEISELFQVIFKQIDSRENTTSDAKDEIKENVELIEEEIQKGDQANEKAIRVHLRNLMRMAPDIFEVVVATIENPALGVTTVIKKIAEKMKLEADQSTT